MLDYFRNVQGKRLTTAVALKSKLYDVLMIALIMVYTLIVLLQFGFEDTLFAENRDVEEAFFMVELGILGVFVVDILVHVYSFGQMYIQDYWNILDIVVILLSFVFVLLDIYLGEKSFLKGILKLRGLFRLLRVFLLVRKLNLVRVRREARKKVDFDFRNDMRAPVEKIIEILNNQRDVLIAEDAEQNSIKELNYCISMISSNKLYEAEFDLNDKADNSK